MKQRSGQTACGYDAREHLAVVQALCREVQGATSALAANQLGELQRSIARQEALCAGLEHAMQRAAGMTAPPNLDSGGGRTLEHHVHAAHCRLTELNQLFAGLLRRCMRSAELLARHYQASCSRLEPSQSHVGNLHTWSSEV